MITKGGSRANRGYFATHFLSTKDNERARVVGVYGFGHEDVNAAWCDMETFAKDKPNCKNFFFTISLNPEPGEVLTDEQWKEAEAIALRRYGAEGQPYISYEHVKDGRTHRHLAFARVDVETGKLLSDSLTYKRNEAISREIEREFGLNVTPSVLVKDREGPRPARRPKDFEGFRASQTGLKAEQVTAEVTKLQEASASAEAFRWTLAENGYILCRGDRRDFCIVDPAGKEHSLARRISGMKAAEVAQFMKDIDRDSLPTVAEGRELASAWGDGAVSDAARAVQEKEMDRQCNAFYRAMEQDGEARRIEAEMEASVRWWARQYGEAVKDVAWAGQDFYWRMRTGATHKTHADKLRDFMWGEKEPGWER